MNDSVRLKPEFQDTVRYYQKIGLYFEDPAEVPNGYSGRWMKTNDIGSITLYRRDDQGNDTELWAVV